MKNIIPVSTITRRLERLPRYSKQAVLGAIADLKSMVGGVIYRYPRPALTVDAVVFGLDDEGLKVLLIQRKYEPFKDCWAFPGGFFDVTKDRNADEAVARELREETTLTGLFLEQLYTFSDKERDPREHVVSVAYYCLVRPEQLKPIGSDDAKEAGWFLLEDIPELAFDHQKILETALARLRAKVRYQPIGFELLPKEFTLSALQKLYESILQVPLDKRNFRKRIEATGVLEPLDDYSETAGKPARLYRFDHEAYQRLVKSGFNFEV
jgi:8-oxo-dGTP diphosphatase